MHIRTRQQQPHVIWYHQLDCGLVDKFLNCSQRQWPYGIVYPQPICHVHFRESSNRFHLPTHRGRGHYQRAKSPWRHVPPLVSTFRHWLYSQPNKSFVFVWAYCSLLLYDSLSYCIELKAIDVIAWFCLSAKSFSIYQPITIDHRLVWSSFHICLRFQIDICRVDINDRFLFLNCWILSISIQTFCITFICQCSTCVAIHVNPFWKSMPL